MPAQIAVVRALEDAEYYRARYRETASLRQALDVELRRLGLEPLPAAANFLW